MDAGISIIICCYNSKQRLPVTLQHLFAQKTQGINWEVIIVDNASTDGTYEFALQVLSTGNIQYQVVKQLIPGQAAARQKGFEVSKFEYLLYCDDDNYLADDYVIRAYKLLTANPKIGILGGTGSAVFEGVEPDWFQKYHHNFAVGEQSSSPDVFTRVSEVYGAGSIMRKEFLTRLFNSGFKTMMAGRTAQQLTSGDDIELCYMANYLGYEVWYNRGLKFGHLMTKNRMNWDYLKKLYWGFGRTNIYMQAYKYVELKNDIPGQNLRLPFWLDVVIHKVRSLINFLPKVIWKINKEGDEDVLRFIAMRAEIREIWQLKDKYTELYQSIYNYRNGAKKA